MITITITSPMMHGPDVTAMQRALKVKGYYTGDIDGYAGPLTGQAFYRAKYWLGYKNPDQTGGQNLYDFLMGTKKPNIAMRALAAKRKAAKEKVLKKNETGTFGEMIIKTALAELGTKESPPNSNRVKYSVWYGIIGPWCAMFCSWVINRTGVKTFFKYAYCPYVVNDARSGRNHLTVTSSPKSGNAALFDWNKDGVADHIGFFAEPAHLQKYAPSAYNTALKEQGKLGSGEFWAVEGNTAYGNDSNGGQVMIRKRKKSQVVVFAVIGKA